MSGLCLSCNSLSCFFFGFGWPIFFLSYSTMQNDLLSSQRKRVGVLYLKMDYYRLLYRDYWDLSGISVEEFLELCFNSKLLGLCLCLFLIIFYIWLLSWYFDAVCQGPILVSEAGIFTNNLFKFPYWGTSKLSS